MLQIIIPIKPLAKQSVRFTRSGIAYQPASSKSYCQSLKYYARSQYRGEPESGAIAVDVIFTFPPLKSFTKKRMDALEDEPEIHCKKPDLDNLAKPLLDAMNGILWVDDSQICQLSLSKNIGIEMGIQIYVHQLDQDDVEKIPQDK